jgi:hypothetical protein
VFSKKSVLPKDIYEGGGAFLGASNSLLEFDSSCLEVGDFAHVSEEVLPEVLGLLFLVSLMHPSLSEFCCGAAR